jgi:HD-GYP domain-containing protein (c-di-GMP phosphodiesterase class II)
MQRHPVEGAEILRRTPEMPTLAPVVAFEHHLRADGTGYPAGVARPRLNLGTTLCGIADVYDAMRSQRVYQEAFPTDRILASSKNDSAHFDRSSCAASRCSGIYPPGARQSSPPSRWRS